MSVMTTAKRLAYLRSIAEQMALLQWSRVEA
jgi:hypothetical protein